MLQKNLRAIYKSLQPLVKNLSTASLGKDDHYKIALKAALVKSYDFNVYICKIKTTSPSFYLTSTLRGICEDIIILKAISGFSQEDRSQFVLCTMSSNLNEGIYRQTQFFEINRPDQLVLNSKEAEVKYREQENKITQIFSRYGLVKSGRRFSTQRLAENCGLLSLYNYLYSATSKWVHFSPQILFRMGWGPEDKPDGIFTFSTKHFNQYYFEFNIIYGTYLFTLFCNTFKNELNLDPKFDRYVNELDIQIDEILRWPELVTFEEMNKGTPLFPLYALYEGARKKELSKKKI